MSKKMKYVIVNCMPVLFCSGMQHSDFANKQTADGAGEVQIFFNEKTQRFEAHVFGGSVSLGLKSNADDASIIERLFNDCY